MASFLVVVERAEVHCSILISVRASPRPSACFVGAVVHVSVGEGVTPQPMLHSVPKLAEENIARVFIVIDSLPVLSISAPLPFVHVAIRVRHLVIAHLSVRVNGPLVYVQERE